MALCAGFVTGRPFSRAFFALFALLPAPAPAASPQAPDFTLHTLSGAEIRSPTLQGKVILLNFWATWCVPCKRELVDLDQALLRYGPDRVAIFAIDADLASAPRQVERQAATMRVPVATSITGDYHPRHNAVPTTYVIDPHGRLVLVKAGAFKPGEIDALIRALLALSPVTGSSH